MHIAAPSASERAKAKRERLRAEAAAAEQTVRERADRELVGRMKAARATGALEVLARLQAFMRKASLRVKDLFTKSGFDASVTLGGGGGGKRREGWRR